MDSKKSKLFLILGGIFIANALLAELIGGKIFSVEKNARFTASRHLHIWQSLTFQLNCRCAVVASRLHPYRHH